MSIPKFKFFEISCQDPPAKQNEHIAEQCVRFGGGEYRDRTGDLLHAMQALSQLSESPMLASSGCVRS